MAKILEINGLPIKVNGQDVYEAVYSGVVKQVDVAARKMTMIGTDETVDRDGDIIETKGWQLENYRKNPVFLWAHNYGSVPLARAEKVIRRKDPVRLEFHLLYPTKGLHPFADMILELYGEFIINASSVGFIPFEWDNIEQEGERQENTRRTWGRRYKKQELLELSGCAVPSNPNALQNALKGKSFLDMPFEEVQKWLQGQSQPPRPKNEDDVMGELGLRDADYIDETKPPMVQVPKNLCSIEEDEEPSFTTEEEIDKKLVEKPYPNEHACRLEDPGKYDRFARKNCYRKHDNKCVDFIFGIKEGKSETQSMRYDKEIWTAGAAKSHCGAHDGTFEAAKEIEEEIKNPVMEKVDLLALKLEDLDKYIRTAVTEVLEILKSKKSIGVGLAMPDDQDSKVEVDGKSVSEAILGEAFERSKVVSPPASIPAQYDFKGVITEIRNLQQSLKSLKGE